MVSQPKIRILILGKSGSGKSSLIQHIFKEKNAKIAHYQPGTADINHGFECSWNDLQFIIHDSMGFETGSDDKYKLVEKFIQDRATTSNTAEQLHAIWLCADVPVAGARVFQSGDENIFKMNLANVPVIVVFTQYDYLITKVSSDMDDENPGVTPDPKELDNRLRTAFQTTCVTPLRKTCEKFKQKLPPLTKTSITPGHESTLKDLVDMTLINIPSNFKQSAKKGSKFLRMSKEIFAPS